MSVTLLIPAELRRSPEVRQIAHGLMAGSDLPPRLLEYDLTLTLVVGALHATWAYFYEQSRNGDHSYVSHLDPGGLDGEVGIPGWSDAMSDAGYLDWDGDGMSLSLLAGRGQPHAS